MDSPAPGEQQSSSKENTREGTSSKSCKITQNQSKQQLWERWVGLVDSDGHSTTCCALAAPVTRAQVTGHQGMGCKASQTPRWQPEGEYYWKQRRDTGISSAGLIFQWDYATIVSILLPCPGQASQDSWVHSLCLHPSSPRCDLGCALPEPLEIFIVYCLFPWEQLGTGSASPAKSKEGV